ncbi:MAG: DUF4974 domain-containing protein [Prevotella sp.]|nr:DUF4974 domain-containing protein [Prevotella sp.]
MKDIDEDELRFVANQYKEQRLDTDKAWKIFLYVGGSRTVAGHGKRRLAAIAASIFAVSVVVACMVAGYCMYDNNGIQPDDAPLMKDSVEQVQKNDSIVVLHFDNAPVNDVMRQLSRHYGCNLSASDTTKRVSGDIQVDSLHTTVDILEQILGIKITVK